MASPDLHFELSVGADRLWPPPDVLKRLHLLSLFQRRGHRTLVESGTYLGDTVAFFLPHAERIVSIELQPDFYADAVVRFAATPAVTILHGDATEHVPRILEELPEPALVWLDGHYSGGATALGAEAEPAVTILRTLGERGAPAGTTLVVDDLRTFDSGAQGVSLPALVRAAEEAFPEALLYSEVDALVIAA